MSALGGWWMRIMYQSLQDLKIQDDKLADKVGKIEVLVAGEYVKKADFEEKMDALFAKLDKIDDKLVHKADKK